MLGCQAHAVACIGYKPRLSHDCSVQVVQVGPANRAESQQRILDAIGQRLFRELPELDPRLQ
jgi:hypothetical protein